jgi:hypothetical protein
MLAQETWLVGSMAATCRQREALLQELAMLANEA